MLCEKMMLIITDSFQNYMNICKSAHGITPFYSYSVPSFTWKAGLKHTGAKRHYKTDIRLRLLFKNNMRGRSSSILGKRHVKTSREKNTI